MNRAFLLIVMLFCFHEASLGQTKSANGKLFDQSSGGQIKLHLPNGKWIGVAGISNTPLPIDKDSISIAVIDSGALTRHPQLKGLIVATKDFTGEGIEDRVGHGTVVAILTRAAQEQLAPEKKTSAGKLLIAKVARYKNGETDISRANVIAAIKWAAAQKAMIVNLSLGFTDSEYDNQGLCDEIASHPDVLFIAAAGNSGPQVRAFPASCNSKNVISVQSDEPTSGLGQVTAPGVARLVPIP